MAGTGITVGVLVFDDVEALDFVGPWEVLSLAAEPDDVVVTISQTAGPVRANRGLRVLPDHTFEDAPDLDVLVVPGGLGTRTEATDERTIAWIREVAPSCRWVTSVCTGAFLLHAAGLLDGRRATTHWASLDRLADAAGVTVVRDTRFVVDGDVVTSAGISAGIDMALWLVGTLKGPEASRVVRRRMEYHPG
jgi:transcriptional regulator GlxA family with amidase domain